MKNQKGEINTITNIVLVIFVIIVFIFICFYASKSEIKSLNTTYKKAVINNGDFSKVLNIKEIDFNNEIIYITTDDNVHYLVSIYNTILISE